MLVGGLEAVGLLRYLSFIVLAYQQTHPRRYNVAAPMPTLKMIPHFDTAHKPVAAVIPLSVAAFAADKYCFHILQYHSTILLFK